MFNHSISVQNMLLEYSNLCPKNLRYLSVHFLCIYSTTNHASNSILTYFSFGRCVSKSHTKHDRHRISFSANYSQCATPFLCRTFSKHVTPKRNTLPHQTYLLCKNSSFIIPIMTPFCPKMHQFGRKITENPTTFNTICDHS